MNFKLNKQQKLILDNLDNIIIKLKEKYNSFKQKPIVTEISLKGNPFAVLISTILSLRTKDATTKKAFLNLWAKAKTPKDILTIEETEIAKLIYPVGFYKTKAKRLKEISKILIAKYNSNVPNNLDLLLELPGVGRKTANLVITLGFGKLGICVDTHVHRISNRLGLVNTKTPEETEFTLREILPKKYWIIINDLLVSYGQNLCKPIGPKCNDCKIKKFCSYYKNL